MRFAFNCSAPIDPVRLSPLVTLVVAGLVFHFPGSANQVTAQITPGITVGIKDVLQLPDTRGVSNATEDSRVRNGFTRINFMKELPDSSNRWFVNDLRGQVYVVDSTTHTSSTYLDVENGANALSRFIVGPSGLSTGLINITPDPNFATNGKFYTIHEESASQSNSAGVTIDFTARGDAGNISNGQHMVISEWTATDPTANTFAGSRDELMRVAQPSGNAHPIGDLLFDPNDGLMYVAIGDSTYEASSGRSPQTQFTDSVFGKILRIDPSGTTGTLSSNGKYSIPDDNPFVDGNGGNVDEVYALGFRNPHRLSYDTVTDKLFTTDIGQGQSEEVNIVRMGENYGWGRNEYEGTFTRGGTELSSAPAGFTFPVAQYLHSELPGNVEAIAGGFAYRGSLVPELEGKFIYGDIISGQLLYSEMADILAADTAGGLNNADVFSLSLVDVLGDQVTLEDLVIGARGLGESSVRVDMRLAQTLDGEIYILSKFDGGIRQFSSLTTVPEPSSMGLAMLVSCSAMLKRRRR